MYVCTCLAASWCCFCCYPASYYEVPFYYHEFFLNDFNCRQNSVRWIGLGHMNSDRKNQLIFVCLFWWIIVIPQLLLLFTLWIIAQMDPCGYLRESILEMQLEWSLSFLSNTPGPHKTLCKLLILPGNPLLMWLVKVQMHWIPSHSSHVACDEVRWNQSCFLLNIKAAFKYVQQK